MYNIVNDLFYTTATSGIQTSNLWYRTSPWLVSPPDSVPDQYNSNNTRQVIEGNCPLALGSFVTGIRLRCNSTTTVKVKIATTPDHIQWYFDDVATISHTANTGWVSYIFQPVRVNQTRTYAYLSYWTSLYNPYMYWLVGSQSVLVWWVNDSDLVNGPYLSLRYASIARHGIQPLITTITEVPRINKGLSLPVTLTSGNYVGLEFQSQSEIKCSEISVDTSLTSSGNIKVDYAQFAGDQLSSDGQYNNNTGYATPKMTYHDEPAGYRASASSEISGYWPYEAFTQTNINESDCWKSSNTTLMSGGGPQCLMFTFSGTGKPINRYQLLSRNHSDINQRGFPRDWFLQGSNDSRALAYNDSYWTTLDTRANVSDPGQNAWTSVFNFDNAQAYKSYRLRITYRYNQSAPTYAYACVGELKLIEADQIYSYPIFSWYPGNWVISSGTHHKVTFSPEKGLDRIRLFFGNPGPTTVTVSGVSVMIRGTDEITMSGTLPTLRYTFNDTDPQFLDIKNTGSGSAFPRLSLSYTGNYEVDRNIFISTDYTTQYDKEESHWAGLDSGGFLVPEHYPWELGTLSGSVVYRRNLQLADTTCTGSWLSPVFNTERNPLRLYVYPTGAIYPKIEVKSADTQPAEAIFSIITTENTHEKLMYKHKRIVLDSNGYVISRVECNSPQTGNKIWRMADYTFAGQPLNYYGAVNSRGTASFMAPGYTTCGDIDPVQEALDPLKWYNLCICKLDDTSLWNTGTSVSGFEWGPTKSVIYTKTFPLENSEGAFFATINTSTSQEITADIRTQVNVGFYNHERVMMAFPIITYRGVKLGPNDYYDVIEDYANNGWWVYLGGPIGKIYKTDVGSFNTIRIFGGEGPMANPKPLENCEYYGYLYYLDIETNYRHIVSIPNQNFSGFWAFTASGIHLFKEEYTNETPSLDNVRQIESSTIISGSFVDLHQGACDALGNLWLVDLDEERLMRVNLKRTLDLNDPNPIDFDNYVSGLINVFPHPTSELAYVLCSESIENPDQDTIHMVSAGQSVGAHTKFVCAVPGFLSSTYKRCVHFTGTTFTQYYRTRATDTNWGLNAGGWYTINNADLLPRGRYSQFRLTLSRAQPTQTTPSVQRLRLPFPITLEPLDKLQTRQVAIKTVFNRAKTFGIFNTNLLVWWFDEEFYYG
jgi:hypothetical protein